MAGERFFVTERKERSKSDAIGRLPASIGAVLHPAFRAEGLAAMLAKRSVGRNRILGIEVPVSTHGCTAFASIIAHNSSNVVRMAMFAPSGKYTSTILS